MTTQLAAPSFLRHAGWVSPEDFGDTIVTVVGCGATGSWIAMTAARMGITRFRIWDPDIVENHNLPNQAFMPADLGKKKVDALAARLIEFNPQIQVEAYASFCTKDDVQNFGSIVFLTVDSMSARKEIGEALKGCLHVDAMFETRLGFDFGEMYYVNPMDIAMCENWLNTLVDDKDVPEGPCNLRICVTLVMMVASTAVHFMCNRFAAIRKDRAWQPAARTLFVLENDKLSTYSI